jgi:hypothetical protein
MNWPGTELGPSAGPYCPLRTIGHVPRAYKGMKWRKNTNKELKKINVIQNKIRLQNFPKKILYKPTCEVRSS